MKSNFERLGKYISPVDKRNRDLQIKNLIGLSIQKKFIPSISNTIGTDMSTYRIINTNQFAYCPVTSRNGEKITIALYQEKETAIISQAYNVFEINNTNELNPEYLMMWFRRPEFDRYARFMSHGSVREIFGWEEMCNVELPIPSLEKQKEIVVEYSTIVNRIKLNEQLNQKLEETAQAIYKQWFVDFEFPISKEYAAEIGKPELEGKPYKSSGGKMVWNDELDQEIPEGWEIKNIGRIINYKKGNAFKSSEYTGTGAPIVKVSNFTENSIDLTNCNFIEQGSHDTYKAYSLNTSDIIISTVGSWPHNPDSVVGKVVKVPLCANGALLNQNTVRLRANDYRLQEYLYPTFRTPSSTFRI
jgi:type I restriction enzyme, S subunit